MAIMKNNINHIEKNVTMLLNNIYNIIPRKRSSLSWKQQKYYSSWIKRYRLLGLLDSKKIKLAVIIPKNHDVNA